MNPLRDENRSIRLGAAIKMVMRFLAALREDVPKQNPWRAVFLRQAIEGE